MKRDRWKSKHGRSESRRKGGNGSKKPALVIGYAENRALIFRRRSGALLSSPPALPPFFLCVLSLTFFFILVGLFPFFLCLSFSLTFLFFCALSLAFLSPLLSLNFYFYFELSFLVWSRFILGFDVALYTLLLVFCGSFNTDCVFCFFCFICFVRCTFGAFSYRKERKVW